MIMKSVLVEKYTLQTQKRRGRYDFISSFKIGRSVGRLVGWSIGRLVGQ